MGKNLTALKIKWYINYLNNVSNSWDFRNTAVYDEETYRILDKLFSLLRRLEPFNKHGTHML